MDYAPQGLDGNFAAGSRPRFLLKRRGPNGNPAYDTKTTLTGQRQKCTRRIVARAAIVYLYMYYSGHMRVLMRKVQLKDAKANLSAVVDQATRGKPSVITRHGKPEAVVLGFRRLGAIIARTLVRPASDVRTA